MHPRLRYPRSVRLTIVTVFTLVALALAAPTLGGCGEGETKHDLYMRGMQVEGEASRGDCRLAYDAAERAHSIDGDQVQRCLERTEEAIALYEKAKAKGLADLDFVNTHQRALERRERLKGMLHTLRELEQPEVPGAPPR